MSHDLTLYYGLVTCARVSLVALEEVGAPFAVRVVDMQRSEQLTPAYRAVNPKGKVPALLIDGELLTETPAILTWLARSYPAAGLLPPGGDALAEAQAQSDLTYVSAGLHPIVTRLCRSQYFCAVPGGPESVFAMAADAMQPNFELVERRLSNGAWWYGDSWSMVDVYLAWIWYRVTSTAFDVSPYPHYARVCEQVAARPATRRADERAAEIAASLHAGG